ncbi:hypothetical protein J7E43_05145, partial [Bacillus sp. ISL-8]|nr:hypothetical protein [Bacillus sp. ISL-8]
MEKSGAQKIITIILNCLYFILFSSLGLLNCNYSASSDKKACQIHVFNSKTCKRKYSNKRKNLDQIENSSYEVLLFQGTVPVSIT